MVPRFSRFFARHPHEAAAWCCAASSTTDDGSAPCTPQSTKGAASLNEEHTSLPTVHTSSGSGPGRIRS